MVKCKQTDISEYDYFEILLTPQALEPSSGLSEQQVEALQRTGQRLLDYI